MKAAICTASLGNLIFVMREDQIDSAAVNIKSGSQKFAGHHHALGMPAGTTFSPGTLPLWFTRFGFFPESKICGMFFLNIFFHTGSDLQFNDIFAGKLAVVFIGFDGKINIAIHFVSKSFLFQITDQTDHFADIFRGFGIIIRR